MTDNENQHPLPQLDQKAFYDFGDGPIPAHKHPNGGGWVANSAIVDKTAYVQHPDTKGQNDG